MIVSPASMPRPKRRFSHGLRPFLKEKTCLIISHRISAVKEADEILVLDDGRIIERGDHEELVRRGGVYAELYQQQR